MGRRPQGWDDRTLTAKLIFPLQIDEQTALEQDLCVIENGPQLRGLERLAVKAAYVFKRKPSRVLAPDVSEMLSELAAEVQSLAESQRFTAAREAFERFSRTHVTLLRACYGASDEALSNAATVVVSPSAWGASTFNEDWLSLYRPLVVVAVRAIEQDLSLFQSIGYAATRLLRGAGPVPARMVAETLVVPRMLVYQLGLWWINQRQMVTAGMCSSSLLQEPKRSTYEKALINFIGAWSSIYLDPVDGTRSDEARWVSACNRVLAYASHMEDSAKFLLFAVRRNDECASSWFSDNFLKWWGNRSHELETDGLEHYPEWSRTPLSLTKESWTSAQDSLHYLSGEKPSLEMAVRAVHVALKRYWEALRLTLCAILLENKYEEGDLSLRIVSSLLAGKPFHSGGTCEANALIDRDAVFAAILEICFGDPAVRERLDNFSEKLRWENDEPKVSGWIYGGSVALSDVRSRGRAWNILLVATGGKSASAWNSSKAKVELWWRKSDTLLGVEGFSRQLAEILRTKDGPSIRKVSARLRMLLNEGPLESVARAQVFRGLRIVEKYANRERTILLRSLEVNPQKVKKWAESLSMTAFGEGNNQKRRSIFCSVSVKPIHNAPERSIRFKGLTKERFVTDDTSGMEWHAGDVASYLLETAVAEALAEAIKADAIQPISSSSELRLLRGIVDACQEISKAGKTPLIFIPPGPLNTIISPYEWNRSNSPQLPPGISISYADSKEFPYANRCINDWPVVNFFTPNSMCFVVPKERVQCLYVSGRDISSALRHDFEVTGDNEIDISVRWSAVMGGAEASPQQRLS